MRIRCIHNIEGNFYRMKMGDHRFNIPFEVWNQYEEIRGTFDSLYLGLMTQDTTFPRRRTCEATWGAVHLFFKLQSLMLGLDHFGSAIFGGPLPPRAKRAAEGSVLA